MNKERNPIPFHGYMTALITPFAEDGSIDNAAFEQLIEGQIKAGIHALVPCGTTGESPTLTHFEHKDVNARAVAVAAGRVPVIAGCGSNSTAESIDFAIAAERAGADGALVIVPYYNKPSQEGIYQHFSAIAARCSIPLILYNIPGRCGVNLELETLARLARIETIVAIKDATADLSLPARVHHHIGETFIQLSGEDATSLAFLAEGGHGCISVSANIAPGLCVDVYNRWMRGDYQGAAKAHRRLTPLHDVLFRETNPAPVKYAAARLGLCRDSLRLPMVGIGASSRKRIDRVLRTLDLISD